MAGDIYTNEDYVAYGITAGVPVVPQPGFTSETALGGITGWTTTWNNYNLDYEPRDVDNNLVTPEPYRRSGEGGQFLPSGVAIRFTDDNQPVFTPQPPLVSGGVATVFSPQGLQVGEKVWAWGTQYLGGTPPINYGGIWEQEDTPGNWTQISPTLDIADASLLLGPSQVGLNIRFSTTLTDATGAVFFDTGDSAGPVVA